MRVGLRGLGIAALCLVMVGAALAPAASTMARGAAVGSLDVDLAPAAHVARAGHPFGVSSASSTNWAGYAVSTSNGAVSAVQGTFVVPKFHGSCSGAYNFSAAAFWVGIDGFSSGTVEQTGVAIECYSVLYVSAVTYFAWYEFYPSAMVVLSMTISPGDTVHAKVSYSSSTYTISLADASTGNSYTSSFTGVSANRSSAEWIAEAPSSSSGILPLVDFGSVSFSKATATVSGSSHPIGSYASYQLTMVNSAGTANKAVPGSLNAAGKGFKVTWQSYGP